jgi:hypothetical protein
MHSTETRPAIAPPRTVIGSGRRWIIAYRYQLVLLIVTVLFSLGVGELTIRAIGHADDDGNFFVLGHRLRPYQLPTATLERAVHAYRTSSTAMVVEDPELGWAPKPGSQNELFTYNNIGARVVSPDRVYSSSPPQGVSRIEVFGDSFALGDEVSARESWPYLVEQRLHETGHRAEVMNLGAIGYGMDQAFLRWRKTGAAYLPGVVVFGLQVENIRRNVNLLRPLYIADLPFAKPRFLDTDEGLRLINMPAEPAQRVVDRVRDPESWNLGKHEAYYNAADLTPRFWQRSRLLAFTVDRGAAALGRGRAENREAGRQYDLAMRILIDFEESVRARGAQFVVLHIPRQVDLKAFRDGVSTPDTRFVRAVSNRFSIVDPVTELLDAAARSGLESLFRKGGHYSPAGNGVLATVLTRRLSAP